MTTTITEGQLRFIFPATWHAEQYDATTHYRNHVQRLAHSKAVDIVALSPLPNRELWLIEVKDYRVSGRSKGLEFFDEISCKVRDTLAGVYIAQRRPEAGRLHELTALADRSVKVRVAVHLEQPQIPSRLRPAITERTNHRIKLRQALASVDKRAEMCEMALMPATVGWAVA